MCDAMSEGGPAAELLVDVIGVEVAGDPREQVDIGLADRLAEARAETDGDVIDRFAAHVSSAGGPQPGRCS